MPFSLMICSHAKEWQRNDNTGQWALLTSPDIQRLKWHRKPELINTSIELNALSQIDGQYLLYPSDDAQDIKDLQTDIKRLWIIDGTWQEAQKMLNQSPWMKALAKVKIQGPSENQPLQSQFKLRRNQRGLSTLEAIEAAVAHQSPAASEGLKNNFNLIQASLLKLMK